MTLLPKVRMVSFCIKTLLHNSCIKETVLKIWLHYQGLNLQNKELVKKDSLLLLLKIRNNELWRLQFFKAYVILKMFKKILERISQTPTALSTIQNLCTKKLRRPRTTQLIIKWSSQLVNLLGSKRILQILLLCDQKLLKQCKKDKMHKN